MKRIAAVTLALSFTLTLGACASSGASTGTTARRNPNQLNTEELAQPSVVSLTLMDAIQRLRPNWLRTRGASSVSNSGNQMPALMVNESFQPLDALRGLRATDVQSAEFMSGTDATTLYGTGYVNGLIKVKTGGPVR